jgi:DedD protein
VRLYMDKEKKKLILVAVSVGVFLVIIISAAILITIPRVPAGEAAFSSAHPIAPGLAGIPSGQPASMDALDTIRNSSSVQGLQAAPYADNIQGTDFYISGGEAGAAQAAGGTTGSDRITIDVPRPSTAAVPDVPAESVSRPATKPAPSVTAAQPVKPAVPKPAAGSKTTATGAKSAVSGTKPAAPAARSAASSANSEKTKHNDYWVQTGAFTAKVRAEGVKETLAEKGITSIIENREIDGKTWYRVRVGPYTSETEANYWLELIKSIEGFSGSQVRQTVSLR